MLRYLFLSGAIIISAVMAPTMLEKVMDGRENSQQQKPAQQNDPAVAVSQPQTPQRVSSYGRKVSLRAGYGGHFYAVVRMNNRPVKVMVDTGATMVAINETTARKIGIHLKPSDFKYKVRTANGITKMASATIREIQIGNIRVKNVRAGVSRDSELSTILLGMSFLNQLKRFEVSGQTLLMVQ